MCLNSKDKDGRITQKPDRSKVCQFPCDCRVTAWSTWSGCPADCSRTEESRTRGVLYPPQLGGKGCGVLVEKRPCSTRCRSYNWYNSSWSGCGSDGNLNTTYCGESFKKRVVLCVNWNAIVKTELYITLLQVSNFRFPSSRRFRHCSFSLFLSCKQEKTIDIGGLDC